MGAVASDMGKCTYLDIPAHFRNEHAPQHGAVLHLKPCELDWHVLKVGHVQGP